MKKVKSKVFAAIVGLLFLAGAGVLAANMIFGLEINVFFDGWWTLFIIIPSFLGLFTRGTRIASVGGLLIGAGLLARAQGYISPEVSFWQMLVVSLLVVVGLSIIAGIFGIKTHGKIKVKGSTEGSDIDAVFGEKNIDYSGTVFTGAEVNGVFGTVTLDLREAIIEKDCKIEVSSVFGEVVILTNPSCRFVTNGGAQVFGVVEDTSNTNGESPVVVTVDATSVFGSVKIQ